MLYSDVVQELEEDAEEAIGPKKVTLEAGKTHPMNRIDTATLN
jgi:hypothetical protein